MGRSIDLYSYNYEKLKNRILEVCHTEDVDKVETILASCGNKIGDRYVILNQEFWEDSSCYYNVATVLERIFKVEDVLGKVFCTGRDNVADKTPLIQAMTMDDIEEELGMEIPEAEDEE